MNSSNSLPSTKTMLLFPSARKMAASFGSDRIIFPLAKKTKLGS